MVTTNRDELPGAALEATRMPGHWLLARMGKRVLRPGGVELTRKLLGSIAVSSGDDVVEMAPGLGATTTLLLEAGPASYVGVDRDPASAELIEALVSTSNGRVIQASAAETGLPDASADVVFGEAYLTMQPDSLKRRIIAELARVLRPGGRLALHEVCFQAGVSEAAAAHVASEMSSAIKVNVTPLTIEGWCDLLGEHGFEVTERFTLPLHLLEPRRLLRDEGPKRALRFAVNVLRDGDARKRVLAMRGVMRRHADELGAIGIVAVYRPTA